MKKQILKKFPAEKRDLEFYRRRQLHDALIHHIIHFDGFLDFNRLVRAIRLSLDAEPYLGCRFVDKFPRPYWERRADLDKVDHCHLVYTEKVDKAIEQFLIRPITDVYNDLHNQFMVIRSNTDTLCIKTNHMLSDGHGGLEYIAILSDIYRQLKKNPDYHPHINGKGSRSLRQIANNFSLLDRLKIIRRGFKNWKSDLFPRSNWSFKYKNGDKYDRGYIIRKIEPDKLRKMKSYGKARGTSVNEVLLTAFCHALINILKPSDKMPLRIVTPVNFRKYIPSGKGESICNLAGVFQFRIEPQPGKHFDETLSIIRHRMDEYKNDYLGLGDYSYMFYELSFLPFAWVRMLNDFFLNLNHKLSPRGMPPGISNIGKISPDFYRFGDVTVKNAFLPGPVMHSPYFLPIVSTFGERINISVGFSGAKQNRPIFENFVDVFLETIPS